MALPPQLHADDAWFDLVPVALIEFNEHGRVLRANSALSALLGYATPAGSKLADCPQALQRLCGWDAPLTLLALGPEDGPLQGQVAQVRPGQTPVSLRSQVWTHAQVNPEHTRRFLCAIRESLDAGPAAIAPGISSDADAAPVPDQAQLLHELSTILESTPSGIAYLRDDVLVRCNRRFERMLGLSSGSMVGHKLSELLAVDPRIDRAVTESAMEVQRHGQFETELEIVLPGQSTRWYALSVRRIGVSVDPLEVIAVLSDVTRVRSQQAELDALGRDRNLMFSLSGVGIAFVRDGHIQSANPALSDLIGESDANLIGRPLSELYASEVDLNTEGDVMSVLRSLGHWQGERALRQMPAGQALWTEVAMRLVNPVRPEEGFIASFVNVDDRHRAEWNLTLQADRTRAILDSVFVGIVTIDVHGIAWMNRSARRMFAGDLADFVGQPLSTVATPDLDHPFRLTDYLDELEDGQSHTFECQVMGRDGRVFWVVGNAVVTLDELGQRQATYAMLDIDRRRQAEAQSRLAQASLARIIEGAPMAITLHEAQGLRIVKLNHAAAQLAGRHEQALLGGTPAQLFGAEQGAQVAADMREALESQTTVQREYPVQTGGTTRLWDTRLLHLAGLDALL